MKRPPEACRESMERARRFRRMRWEMGASGPTIGVRGCTSRLETAEIVRALRAARRTEGALLARWGVAE